MRPVWSRAEQWRNDPAAEARHLLALRTVAQGVTPRAIPAGSLPADQGRRSPMNYTDHTNAVTARLVDMIRTGSHGQWSMPWHTHGIAGLLNARNATIGTPYKGLNTISGYRELLHLGLGNANNVTARLAQSIRASREQQHVAFGMARVPPVLVENGDP